MEEKNLTPMDPLITVVYKSKFFFQFSYLIRVEHKKF
jgi:hypothetical protein